MKTNTLLKSETQVRIQALKLGVDWHADPFRVVRMCDGQSPQPAQRFTPGSFLPFVEKQRALADEYYKTNNRPFLSRSNHAGPEERQMPNLNKSVIFLGPHPGLWGEKSAGRVTAGMWRRNRDRFARGHEANRQVCPTDRG